MAVLAALSVAALADAGAARAECACVNRDGTRYNLGEVACLRVDGRAYLVECQMNLNVTSWKKIDDNCPEAHNGPQQSLWQRQASL